MGDKAYKQLHKAIGLCLDCSEPAEPGFLRCNKHGRAQTERRRRYEGRNRAARNAANLEIRARFIRQGRCRSCSIKLDLDCDAGRVTCVNCRERTGAAFTNFQKQEVIFKCKS